MILRTLIIDDEPIALEKLRKYVEKVPFMELSAACESAFEAIDYLATNEVDLIMTDINMPDLNGLDFIKTLTDPPMVIFTTAYGQYALDGYRLSAVDYLLKPYDFVDFQKSANKALEYAVSRKPMPTNEENDRSMFIKVDYRYVRVSLSDISYIKGYGEYLQIMIKGKETPLVTLSSFAAVKEKLSPSFLQVHRSYITNMDHVEQIERGRISMNDGTMIPIGDSYRNQLNEFLRSHAIGKGQK